MTGGTARNQESRLAGFLAKKPGSGALRAELAQASENHSGADSEAVLRDETARLADATARPKDIADQHFRRGECAR